MNRMIALTGISLCLVSVFFNLAFADRLQLSCEECRVLPREVRLTVKNPTPDCIKRFSVLVKVFEGDKEVSSSTVSGTRSVKAGLRETLRLSLKKELKKGSQYQVVAYLQCGGGAVEKREWTLTAEEDAFRRPFSMKDLGKIREPGQLRNSIPTIDPRKEMGLL